MLYIYILGVMLHLILATLITKKEIKEGKDFDLECLILILLFSSLSFIGVFITTLVYCMINKNTILIKGKK